MQGQDVTCDRCFRQKTAGYQMQLIVRGQSVTVMQLMSCHQHCFFFQIAVGYQVAQKYLFPGLHYLKGYKTQATVSKRIHDQQASKHMGLNIWKAYGPWQKHEQNENCYRKKHKLLHRVDLWKPYSNSTIFILVEIHHKDMPTLYVKARREEKIYIPV